MKLEEEKEKFDYIDVDKIMDKVLKDKNIDVQKLISNIGKSNIKEINNNNNKNNNIKYNSNIINRLNKIDITDNLLREKNKGKIIDLLLYSQMPDDIKIHRKKFKKIKF